MKIGLDNDKKIQSLIHNSIMALFTALSLIMTMAPPGLENWQSTDKIAEVFWNLEQSLTSKGSLVLIAWIFYYYFYRIVSRENWQDVHFPTLTINIVLSTIWLMAEGYRIDNSLHSLTSSIGQLVKSIIYFLGTFWELNVISSFLFIKLSEGTYQKKRIGGLISKLVVICSKHSFVIGVVLIFIAWLPHIIIAYPGYFCPDTFNQLSQYFGFYGWSSHHPPFSTYIMGTISQLGVFINDHLGPYLFIMLQAVIAAMVISYGFCLFIKMKTPYWIRSVYAISVILVPYYTDYVCVFLKDNLYSYCFLLMSIELIYLLIDESEITFKGKSHILLWIVSAKF